MRTASEFKGDKLIVGCGTSTANSDYVTPYPSGSCLPSLHPAKDFYTIDITTSANPDLVADFTKTISEQRLPNNRFSFILFETVPGSVIEDSDSEALNNAARLINENGVVLIQAGFSEDDHKIEQTVANLKASGFSYGRFIFNQNLGLTAIVLSKNLKKIDDQAMPEIFYVKSGEDKYKAVELCDMSKLVGDLRAWGQSMRQKSQQVEQPERPPSVGFSSQSSQTGMSKSEQAHQVKTPAKKKF